MSTRTLAAVDPYILQQVERACAARAACVRVEMGRGLPALATIASTAVLIGSLGMALGIFRAFVSFGSSRSAILAAITDRLSQAMLPFLLGLAVSLFAFCAHRYFQSRLENLYLEMQAESSILSGRLRMLLRRGGITTPLNSGKWLYAEPARNSPSLCSRTASIDMAFLSRCGRRSACRWMCIAP